MGNIVSASLRRGLFTRIVGQRILFFQEVASTMDEAVRLADSGAAEGTVIVAEAQRAGRGRFQRKWISAPGNLYLSIILRPTPQASSFLSMLSAVAVARAIRQATGLTPRLKWPNDVLTGGKKVAGTLVESVLEGSNVRCAIVGVGINVSLDTANAPRDRWCGYKLERCRRA